MNDLFALLAEKLSDAGYSVSYVDYDDGGMRLRLRHNKRIKHIGYKINRILQIDDQDVVIFQSMLPWSIYRFVSFHRDTKILFWNCHPLNLVVRFPYFAKFLGNPKLFRFLNCILLPTLNYKNSSFISFIMRQNALVFMDRDNLMATQTYNGLQFDAPNFLPIPVALPSFQSREEPMDNMRFCWAGRMVDSKCFTLMRCLQDLETEGSIHGRTFSFAVIGDGNFRKKLEEHCKNFQFVKVTFYGYLSFDDLMSYLDQHVDAFFASGTLALLGAKIGLPTILMDIAYQPVSSQSYNYIYKAKDYSLGKLLKRHPDNRTSVVNMASFLKDLSNNHKIRQKECFVYVENNHNVDAIIPMLKDYCEHSELKWGELLDNGFLKRPFIYRIYNYVRGKMS